MPAFSENLPQISRLTEIVAKVSPNWVKYAAARFNSSSESLHAIEFARTVTDAVRFRESIKNHHYNIWSG